MPNSLQNYTAQRFIATDRMIMDVFNDRKLERPERRLCRSKTYNSLINNQLSTKQLVYQLEFN